MESGGLDSECPERVRRELGLIEFFYCKARCGTNFYDLLRPDETSLL